MGLPFHLLQLTLYVPRILEWDTDCSITGIAAMVFRITSGVQGTNWEPSVRNMLGIFFCREYNRGPHGFSRGSDFCCKDWHGHFRLVLAHRGKWEYSPPAKASPWQFFCCGGEEGVHGGLRMRIFLSPASCFHPFATNFTPFSISVNFTVPDNFITRI